MAQKSWYEKMDCNLASWEADIIILFFVNDAAVVERIKEVATAKL
jgi:hypothetical protein